MSVPTPCVAFYLTFFLGSSYVDGVPMLRYSVPVIKAAIDDVKVCHRGISKSIGSLLTFDL